MSSSQSDFPISPSEQSSLFLSRYQDIGLRTEIVTEDIRISDVTPFPNFQLDFRVKQHTMYLKKTYLKCIPVVKQSFQQGCDRLDEGLSALLPLGVSFLQHIFQPNCKGEGSLRNSLNRPSRPCLRPHCRTPVGVKDIKA